MTRLAMIFLLLFSIGGMLVLMPETVAHLPFADRMWSYGLAVLFFAMGFVCPEQS